MLTPRFQQVAPNLPGFINSINPKINAGVGSRPYTFAWLLGFAITALIFVSLSTVFPPRETMISRAVLPDEVYEAEDNSAEAIDGEELKDDVEARRMGLSKKMSEL